MTECIAASEVRGQIRKIRNRVQYEKTPVEVKLYGDVIGVFVPISEVEKQNPQNCVELGITEFRQNFTEQCDRLRAAQVDCIYLLRRSTPVMAFVRPS